MAKLNTESEQNKRTVGDMRSHNVRQQMLSYVERYERLQEEKDALADDQKEVMSEAKGVGFDTAILRKVIQRRKVGAADLMEADSLLELYEETIRLALKDQKIKDPAPEPEPAKKAWCPPAAAAQMDIEEVAPVVSASIAPVAEALATEPETPWPDDQQAAEVVALTEEPPPVPHSDLPDPPAFLRRAK